MPEPRRDVLLTPEIPHGGPDGTTEPPTDFSVNSNPFGPPEALLALLAQVDVSRYPDPSGRAAREVAATRHEVGPDRVTLGNGTSELIHRLAACYLERGDRVVLAAPTFGEYARASQLYGAQVHLSHAYLGARPDPEPVLQALRATRPKLVWLCQPNNPTGQAWSGEDLYRLGAACQSADALLVVDLAYSDLCEIDCHHGDPYRALVLHSLTKSLSVPGLRVGYAVGPPAVIGALERLAAPWQASAHAQAAVAWGCGREAEEFLERTLPRLFRLRDELKSALARLGYRVSDSVTPYFLVEAGDSTSALCQSALQAGFRLRDCTSFGLPEYVRLATRKDDENRRLVRWLESQPTASPRGTRHG